MHILSIILKSKSNHIVKFVQLREYRIYFLQFQTSFCFSKKALYKVKVSGLQLSYNRFRQPSIWQTIKTNCIKLQTIDPDITSTLTFQKRVWEWFLHHILCMIFQRKCFTCYILLTGPIALCDCICFLRHWVICILQQFVSQVLMS